MSTKTRPEGGALTLILDRWISGVQQDVLAEGLEPGTEAFAQRVEMRIHEVVGTLSELVHGFDLNKHRKSYNYRFKSCSSKSCCSSN